jgi:hypothetical protein
VKIGFLEGVLSEKKVVTQDLKREALKTLSFLSFSEEKRKLFKEKFIS